MGRRSPVAGKSRSCRTLPPALPLTTIASVTPRGTSHCYLEQALALGAEVNREVTRTGDLSSRTVPGSTHHCHMFRAGELRDLLERSGFIDLWLSASSALSTGVASSLVAREPPHGIRCSSSRAWRVSSPATWMPGRT